MENEQEFSREFDRFARKGRGISSGMMHDYYRHFRALTPYIIEERPLNIAQMDVFSRLMMDRIIFLGDTLTDYFANVVIAQMLFLDSVDPDKDIQMYLNCRGGVVHSGLGIYDTMQHVRPDVATICVGVAASMGAVIMCAGTAGKRVALPHARFMMHQPSGGIGGQETDIQIMAQQLDSIRAELYEVLAKHTGKSVRKIVDDCDRDFWLRAKQAKAYGLIDDVLHVKTQPQKTKEK